MESRNYVEIVRQKPFIEIIFGELVFEDRKSLCIVTEENTRRNIELGKHYAVTYIKTTVSKASNLIG